MNSHNEIPDSGDHLDASDFNVFEDAIVPFSLAFTAGELLMSLSNQIYRATEHAIPQEPKTLIALGFAALATIAFNRQK
jgi:hypothetical protein